ncbi:MAG: hypothetical protein IJ226_00190 [Clostridia bacterium]|nr:hypothetical protein [Clostridia bacterium]
MTKPAVHTADKRDFDEGGGIFVPSSFSRIGSEERTKLLALSGDERERYISELLGIEAQGTQESTLVELEEDVFVLELDRARKCLKERQATAFAAELASVYFDLETEGRVRVFLPYEKALIYGAVFAEALGIPLEIFVATDKKERRECESVCDELKTIFPSRKDISILVVGDEVEESIKNFSDFDDYVFGLASGRATVAFEAAEGEEDVPSIIVATDSPLDNPKEVLACLGEKAKDEDEAKKKLATLFAIEN